ncbi:hypothetical protein WJX74_006015 [Apatococcus lobatus]|uniref:Uncharacterized protein n=1 Tax=Apatococcus lobatus TaxID=904363 RepID=A0AAW1S6R0_9CHLO
MQALHLSAKGLVAPALGSSPRRLCRTSLAQSSRVPVSCDLSKAPLTSQLAAKPMLGSSLQMSNSRPARCKVAGASGAGMADNEIGKEAPFLRQIGWISFWSQLALAIVSSIIIGFALTGSGPGGSPSPSVWFSLFGVIMSFVTTFMSYGFTRVARRVILNEGSVKKQNVIASLLRVTSLNLWGLGGTLIGLQSTVGVLVGKTLTSSSTSPYTASGVRNAAPAALDVFSVQASSNTLLAHFISIVLAQWLLRVLNKGAEPAQPSRPNYSTA